MSQTLAGKPGNRPLARFIPVLAVLAGIVVSHPAPAASDAAAAVENPSFEQLLREADLVFAPPAGYRPVAAESNPVLPYEHAIRNSKGTVEIRYVIRPLARLKIDYNDPHSSAPEPDHVFPMVFQALIERLAVDGGRTPRREYKTAEAKKLFNADWASASVFDINREFSKSYREALLLAIHKNGKADAYAIILYENNAKAKALIREALPALSFKR